jgi:hypothetical protein
MRGKVTFEAAGQDYALQFTTNRLCELEEEAGEKILAICARMENPEAISFIDLRRIFRAGLVGVFSHTDAGDILDEVGMQRGLILAAQAMSAAFDIDTAGKPGKAPAGKNAAGAV